MKWLRNLAKNAIIFWYVDTDTKIIRTVAAGILLSYSPSGGRFGAPASNEQIDGKITYGRGILDEPKKNESK